MPIFDEKVTKQLTELIGDLHKSVTIELFVQKDCPSCEATEAFVNEIAEMNEKISVNINDLDKNPAAFKKYNIENATPALAIISEEGEDYGIRFFGIPSGYEINSFVASIREVGGMEEPIPDEVMKRIKAIDKAVHIQVFVTPTCPYCPGPVMLGHKLAMLNKNIKADMVEATTFPELSQKYAVRGVPKIIINETNEFVGSQPLSKFLDVIESL